MAKNSREKAIERNLEDSLTREELEETKVALPMKNDGSTPVNTETTSFSLSDMLSSEDLEKLKSLTKE